MRGLKFVNINLPIDSDIRQKDDDQNDIHNLIQEIMGEFNATPAQIKETLHLYEFLINKSSLLNRSRPGSVAAAIVKFYILKKSSIFRCSYLGWRFARPPGGREEHPVVN